MKSKSNHEIYEWKLYHILFLEINYYVLPAMRIMIIENEYKLKSWFTCYKKLAKIACLNKVNGFTKSLFSL